MRSRRSLLGDEHPDIAESLNNLALVLQNRGKYDEAEQIYHQDLALRRKIYGLDHPEATTPMHNLAALYRDRGDYVAAESLFQVVVDMRTTSLGDDHYYVALSLYNLALVFELQGECHRAAPLLRRAIGISNGTLGETHWVTAHLQSTLGGCMTTFERYAEAEALLLDAYTLLRRERGEDNRYTQEARERLVVLYEAWGRPDDADAYRDAPRP